MSSFGTNGIGYMFGLVSEQDWHDKFKIAADRDAFHASARVVVDNEIELAKIEAAFIPAEGGVAALSLLPKLRYAKIIQGTIASYFNPVSGGTGLNFGAQAVRYIGTARYWLRRPFVQMPASLGKLTLRHYTDEATILKIKESMTLLAGRRNLVYNIIGGDDVYFGAKEAESMLGMAPGRGATFLEYEIEASRVKRFFHPWTNILEYNVEGAVDLEGANARFFIDK
jgi:hypothetical protein